MRIIAKDREPDPPSRRLTTMIRRMLIAGLVVLGLVVAGCGDDGGEVDTGGPTTSTAEPDSGSSGDELDGRTFLSTGVTVDGEEHPLVEGTQVTVTFDAGTLGASAGCNQIGGDVSLGGGRLQTGALAMTEMGCDEPLMEQDEWLADFLSSGPAWSLDGDTLTLTGEDGTVIVLVDREVADPDRALVGPTWTGESIIEGETASSITEGFEPTFEFSDDGTVSIFDGCNQGSANYEIEGDEITFDSGAFTLMACPEGSEAPQQAVAVLLSAPSVSYSIEADLLSLRDAEGDGVDLRAES